MAEIAYEFTITILLEPEDTTEDSLIATEEAILDAVCQRFGGHTTDEEGNEVCPRGFVAGFKKVDLEEEK